MKIEENNFNVVKYKVLFLTILDFDSLEDRNIYTDLLSEFFDQGHQVFAISPIEKKNWKLRKKVATNGYTIIKPKIGNIQKSGVLEKGISTILLESRFMNIIRKELSKIKFDLIIYSTPPITFFRCVNFVKKRDGAISYLLLKDIFPQNAVDIGILKKTGLIGLIYKYFRKKEIALYRCSDYIGCMSEANVNYIISNNDFLKNEKVEVNPNSERECESKIQISSKREILDKYNIPQFKKILIYGGNLGKPQGVDFITSCILDNEENNSAFIIIFGSGTEYKKIENFISNFNIKNTKLFPTTSKNSFEQLVFCSDVGLVFLDSRFTIPNFPSRIIAYMKYSKPIIVASDNATDLGKIAKQNRFGDYCNSNNSLDFKFLVKKFTEEYDLVSMGKNAYDYYYQNYRSIKSYELIINRMKEIKK